MSGALAECRGLTWTPDGLRSPALDRIDLRIEPGERLLLAGPSGSGKSTLLRALAGVLHVGAGGEQTGQVLLLGRPAAEAAASVGLLVQDPRDARVAQTVGRDVAFGCENLRLPPPRIATAVDRALRAVRFPYGPLHSTSAVSGGEAQRLALAGVVAPRPDLVLLDEPTSMLDTESAAAVREAVLGALDERSALVVVEHRLRHWLPLVRRMVVLDARGRLAADGPVADILAAQADSLTSAGVWVPGRDDPEPLTVPPELLRPSAGHATGDLLRAWDLSLHMSPPLRFTGAHRPPQPATQALAGVDATVTAGRVLALRGGSGAGKSSLVSVLCGLVAPTGGRVQAAETLAAGLATEPHRWRSRELARRIGWVPQEPGANVVGATVRDCLLATVRALGLGTGSAGHDTGHDTGHCSPGHDRNAEALAEILGLQGLLGRHPHRLSGGEARRLALASGLLHGPSVVCLDEPTVGQDRHTWAAVVGLVLAARAAGAGLVVSTHDETLAARADATLRLVRGRVRS